MEKGSDTNYANEIYNVEKRGRSERSAENNQQPVRKQNKTTHTEDMVIDVDNVSNIAENGKKLKTKRLRAPPRKIPVVSNPQHVKSIWKKFEDIEVTTNLKELIINDKEAQKDLRDGLRFIMGRKPKPKMGPMKKRLCRRSKGESNH